MHPPAHLFALWRRRAAPAVFSWHSAAYRCAHAAAFADANEDGHARPAGSRAAKQEQQAEAGPSRPRRRMEDYRFPERGKRGGPPDPYEVLGLERTASAKDIKTSYYKLALILHPDSSHPSASAEHFATLNRAYKLLSAPSSRNSYLQTGYGWDAANPAASPGENYAEASMDAAMREYARHARRHGAASWAAGARARGGFRESDAGRGAWYYHTHPGEDFPFHDKPPKGTGEELYMSNNRFVILIASLGGIFAFVQWMRLNNEANSARDLLVDRHIHASNALAEARHEAALFGAERRDKIRRRVRESNVLSEIGKMERGEHSDYSHAGIRSKAHTVHHPPAIPPPSANPEPPSAQASA